MIDVKEVLIEQGLDLTNARTEDEIRMKVLEFCEWIRAPFLEGDVEFVESLLLDENKKLKEALSQKGITNPSQVVGSSFEVTDKYGRKKTLHRPPWFDNLSE